MLQKMHSFILHKIQLITIFLLIHNSYLSWSTWFNSLNLCVGFPIFQFCLVLLNFSMDSLTLKHHIIIPFKIKIIEKWLTVLLSDLQFLKCNKHMFQPPRSSKQEVCNKSSIYGGGPTVGKICDFRLFGKPGTCIL